MKEETAKQPLIILTGPTAVGKTALSMKLAERVGGEIISADSMQVYRHMDIGSAKIRPDEMAGIPHHLIDILEPWEEFNVTVFQKKSEGSDCGYPKQGACSCPYRGDGILYTGCTV